MSSHKQNGFTLIELAMVLFIVGLLLGGLLMPMASQMEQRDQQQTLQQLEEIKQSLLGYAVINGSFPCPSTETNPASSDYGEPGANCTIDGILPWKVLGVPEYDPWRFHWRYRVDSNFGATFDLNTTPDDNLSVVDSNAITLTAGGNNTPVFIVYSMGPNRVQDGQNAVANTTFQGGARSANFDDITIWMTRPILLSTMISAKRLP